MSSSPSPKYFHCVEHQAKTCMKVDSLPYIGKVSDVIYKINVFSYFITLLSKNYIILLTLIGETAYQSIITGKCFFFVFVI